MPKLPQCPTCRYHAHHYSLVCALHPTGIDGENCPDCDPDPNLEGRQFRDFLGLGEPAEIDGTIENPYSENPEENWALEGWQFVRGELRRVE